MHCSYNISENSSFAKLKLADECKPLQLSLVPAWSVELFDCQLVDPQLS